MFQLFSLFQERDPGKEGVVIPGTWNACDPRHVIE
jgi:hypothetical protein